MLGEHDVSVAEDTEQHRRVAEVVLYSGRFGRSRGPRASAKSDIALLRLDRPAIFTDFVQPIELPESTDDFTGEKSDISHLWSVICRSGEMFICSMQCDKGNDDHKLMMSLRIYTRSIFYKLFRNFNSLGNTHRQHHGEIPAWICIPTALSR